MTFATFLVEQRGYRRIFVQAHGPWPHDCTFCGGVIDGHTRPFDATAAVVHHADGDHGNDTPGNLVSAHHGCHARYHGLNARPETRAKLRAASQGRTHTPETLAKIGAASRTRTASPETRAKMSAVATGRTKPLEHRAAIGAAQEGKPKGPLSPAHRANIADALKGKPLSPKARAAQQRAVSSPEGRARLRRASMSIPHASCVNCQREFRIGAPLVMHVKACRP